MSENLKPENKALVQRVLGYGTARTYNRHEIDRLIDAAREEARAPQAGEPKPVACGLDTNAAPFADNGIGGLMLARGEAYLDQYAMGTEGADHEPDESEREMLADFMAGLMNDEAMFGPVRELLGLLHAAEAKAKQFADVAMTNAVEVNRLLAESYAPPKADPDVGLSDHRVVHLNMARGSIAKLTPAQIGHLYRGDEAKAVIAEIIRQNPEAKLADPDVVRLVEAVRRLRGWLGPAHTDDVRDDMLEADAALAPFSALGEG